MKFKYSEEVEIVDKFFEGFKGIVNEYEEYAGKVKYDVHVISKENSDEIFKTRWFNESQLKKIKSGSK